MDKFERLERFEKALAYLDRNIRKRTAEWEERKEDARRPRHNLDLTASIIRDCNNDMQVIDGMAEIHFIFLKYLSMTPEQLAEQEVRDAENQSS